jgi:hypothetical protein
MIKTHNGYLTHILHSTTTWRSVSALSLWRVFMVLIAQKAGWDGLHILMKGKGHVLARNQTCCFNNWAIQAASCHSSVLTFLSSVFQHHISRTHTQKLQHKEWKSLNHIPNYGPKFCSTWTHYWLTAKQIMKHLLLHNRFLISKYKQPLLSNAFTNKQVPMATSRRATIEELLETMFSTQSMPRCYDNWIKSCGIFARQ